MKLCIECDTDFTFVNTTGGVYGHKTWFDDEEAMWRAFDLHVNATGHKANLRVFREDGSQFSGPPPAHMKVAQTPDGYEPE